MARQKKEGRKVSSSAAFELPAVKTTIVGGRPPGSGKGIGEIPRGIEVLVKKASVDPAFKALLLARRSKAADEIGLLLEEAEALMLDVVPAAQLDAIIARTKVDRKVLPAFLGKAAAVMLVALGATTVRAQVQAQNGVRVAGPPVATAPAGPPVMRPAGIVVGPLQPLPTPVTSTQPTQPASQPASLPAAQRAEVARLIAQLDSEKYADRQDARKKLTDMGPAVVPVLKEALTSGKLSVEQKSSIESIINKVSPTPTPPVRPPIAIGVRALPIEINAPAPIAPPVPPADRAVGGGPVSMPASGPATKPADAPAKPVMVRPLPPVIVRNLPAIVPDGGPQPVLDEGEQPVVTPAPRGVADPLPPIRVAGIVAGPLPTQKPTTQASQPTSRPTSQPTSALAVPRAEVDKLIAQLDSDKYADRQEAQEKLADLGPAVVPALKDALANGKLSAEQKSSIEGIINKLSPTPSPTPDTRLMRGIRPL
ncbi:MAG: hypothetical protein ACE15C_13940 [Phycisphaerae bacterium]